MGSWRLGRVGYVLAIGVLLAAQGAPFFGFVDSSGWSTASLWMWVGAWQLLKLVPTLGRCNDLGRSPDDAVFTTLIPIGANVYGFLFLFLDRTPSEKRWNRIRSRWLGQPAWFSAAPTALTLMARTPLTGLIGAAVLSIPLVWLCDFAESRVDPLTQMDPATREMWLSGFLGLSGLLTAYVLVQLTKYSKTTVRSWLPGIFWLPSWLVVGLLYAPGTLGYDFEPMMSALLNLLVVVLWSCLVGTAVVLLWLVPAAAVRAGEPKSLGDVFTEVRARYGRLLIAHSARVQWVLFGSQIVIPGLFYWVYSAFVDVIGAVEDDETNLTEASGRMSWGMMPRLVKLCAVYIVSWLVPSLSLVSATHGSAMVQTYLMGDLSDIDVSVRVGIELWGGLVTWWVMMMLMIMYFGRREQLAKKARPVEAASVDAPA